jgi:hypothetical protein
MTIKGGARRARRTKQELPLDHREMRANVVMKG